MAGEASTNRVRLAYIKEDTFGVVKSGANLQVIRPTGESLKQDTAITVSQEIRSDRQTANVVRTGVSASGGVNFELTHDTYDDWLKSALQSAAWSAPVTVGPIVTISFAAAGSTIADTGNGLAVFAVNQWIKISGAANAENNGFAKIATVGAGAITVTGKTFVDEVAGASVTIVQGKYIENGTTLDTYNIEREYGDLATTLALFTGMAINSFSLNVPVDGIVNGSFAFMGKIQDGVAASAGSGYTAATTTKPMTAVNDLETVLEGGSSSGFLNFGLTVNNNLRARQEAGTLGAIGIGVGKCSVEGTMEAYFRTQALMDKYLDQTETSFALVLSNVSSESYVIDFPAVRITDGSNEAGGENQDVIAKIKWNAFMSATEGKTVRIASFG